MASGPLALAVPDDPSEGELLDAFLGWTAAIGLDLYPHQEEAILELFAGNNVILTTPTGSGKSLVAEAAHYAALHEGRSSVYTAPIKALVSEKFFDLCRAFGSDQVGMVTGDAAVNGDAPIICCTAEILANRALRHGRSTDADVVIMDEFHFYADPQRGWAWQIPLLELSHAQFLLISATLGPTGRFEHELTTRTGRPTREVTSTLRPVPLSFEYRETPLHESLEELLATGRAPVYLVHFTQADAMTAAQALTSTKLVDADAKEAIRDAIGDFRFDSPVGRDLRRYLAAGVGVHHAGLLPRYRLLVEKLAQQGLLPVICGTDTLGVGVNVPIRSVLFTKLCKYDGTDTRVLRVREFQQIAGRAGRKGFDDEGFVWAQAPEHWIENRRMEAKAGDDPRKKRKLVKRKPPEWGYAPWNDETFARLVNGSPEPLDSSFTVSHQMLLNVLDRPGDGCGAMKRLLLDNHETRRRRRTHIRRAISMYRALLEADVVQQLDRPDAEGRRVRVTIDLQDEFALNQPLSLFAVEAITELLDRDAPDYALDVLSVVEAVLEDPRPVLRSQLDRAKGELIGRLKAEGVDYDERMAELSEVDVPRPLGDLLWGAFRVFRRHHPWVGDATPRPKSVARELHEMGFGFDDYVRFHGLKRSEGLVLRYLGDAYKGLVQNVPEAAKTEEVWDLQEWLGELVRQVDSSLVDEWERIRAGLDGADVEALDPDAAALSAERSDVTANTRAFRVMVRNEAFRWVVLLARRDLEALAEVPRSDGARLRPSDLESATAPYWAEYTSVGIDADARNGALFDWDPTTDRVVQIVDDPDGDHEWRFHAVVDRQASREAGRAVLAFESFGRLA